MTAPVSHLASTIQQAPLQQLPQQAPAQQTQTSASQPAFPIRTSHTPSVGSSSPVFIPHVTRARGS